MTPLLTIQMLRLRSRMARTAAFHGVIVPGPSVMEAPSAAGDLITRTFAAFAQFERDQLMERTQA
jgi:DNA invertase Pin-like site-specific DNA recombinase